MLKARICKEDQNIHHITSEILSGKIKMLTEQNLPSKSKDLPAYRLLSTSHHVALFRAIVVEPSMSNTTNWIHYYELLAFQMAM